MSDLIVKPFTDGVFKLHAGNDPLGMMGCLLRDAAPSINRGKMSAKVTISRQSPDRARDVMIAKGGRLQNHARNPTVQFQHSRVIPCGRAMDGLGTYTVKMHADGAGYSGETFFSQNTEIGEQAFRLVESKVLCGASIGFMPVEGQMKKSYAGGVEYLEWELVEYSHVAIPEHPDCLVEAVYKGIGGKPLCDPIMSVLAPMCPPKNEAVMSGWEFAPVVIKSGTYKTAEAKEVEPLHRESTYYVCPHCLKEITAEHIHRDSDGKTRHGECRGEIILKKPEHVSNPTENLVGTHPTAPPSVANHVIHGVPKSLQGIYTKDWNESEHPRDGGKFTHAGAGKATKKAHEASTHAAEVSRKHYRSESDADYALSHANRAITHHSKKESGLAKRSHEEAQKEHSMVASRERGLGYHEVADAHEQAAKHHEAAHKYRTELATKSLRYTHKPKRFLPGLRTKAMPPTYDDPNAVAPADDTGEFVDPLDDPEEQGSGMKSGAEAHHGVNDILMQALAFIEDSQGTVDNATAKKTLEKVSKWISKAMQALHAGHEAYLGEHPDQPELPGAEGIGPGDGDEDEDGTDDFEDDDDGLDADGDGEDEDGELEDDMDDSADGDKKPKKKKKDKPFGDKEEKAAREWRTKAVDAYWESLKRDAVKGDAEVITKAIADLEGDVAFEKRMAVKGVVKSLKSLVTKEAKPEPAAVVADRLSDDWYDEENSAKNGTH